MPGYDTREEQHKLEIELLFHFAGKLLKILNKYVVAAEKCSKELSNDA